MHTPGPWTLKQHGPNHFTLTGQAPGLIADIHSDQDAALVRAAPDLLAALQAILEVDHPDADYLRMVSRAKNIARAAINKATEM